MLRARFLNGTPKQRQFVERFTLIWTAYANIRFEFGDDQDAEIRVSFKEPGSWAYQGTDALTIPPTEPTANFGWINDDTPATEADFTILHEFGHVLGLYHEHQNPLAKIPWKKDVVYKAYDGPPNYWDHATVDHLLFNKYDRKFFPFEKPFDPGSIMAFPIPSEFTDGDFEIGQNRTLSQGDKEFIARLYPHEVGTDQSVESKSGRRQAPKPRRPVG